MVERVPRIPVTLAALAAVLAVVLAGVAASEAKLGERSSRSAELGPGEAAGKRVKCKGRKRHLVSGGFRNDSPWRHDDNATVAFFGSFPTGGKGWRARAANFRGERETFTVSALCSRTNPRVKTLTEVIRVPPAQQRKATLRCPPRREAIAGGFDASAFALDTGAEVIPVESRRKGRRKWRLSAYNNSGTVGGELVAYARCAKRRPGLKTERVKGVAVDQAPLELRPRCERRNELWSGGFVADFQSFDPFALILADRSYPDGKRWVSRFVGMQAGGNVTAIAYCRDKG